jgi:hypothetical protein
VLPRRALVERDGRQQVVQDVREVGAEDLPEDDGLGQEFPPSLLAPCTPAVDSPTAKSPSTAVAPVRGSTSMPPMP